MTMDDHNNDLRNNALQNSAAPNPDPQGETQPLLQIAEPPIDPPPPIITAPPQPSLAQKMFLGPDGLRAGWSLLLFIILSAAVLLGVAAIAKVIHPPSKQPSGTQGVDAGLTILGETIPFLSVVFVSWLMSKIEGRRFAAYGLAGKSMFSYFFAGLAWGVICLSLLILTLWKTGLLVFDARLIFGRDILRYGALWLIGFLCVGLQEEFVTRGYLQYTLARGFAGLYRWAFKSPHSTALGFWTGAVILSIMFGLLHKSNPGESPIGLLSAGSVGLVFCLSLWRTGSLWWAIGFHASWDWAQSFLYGVADSGTMVEHHLYATHPLGKPILSGGLTGPEGSIFVLAILLLTVLIIIFTLPRTRHDYASLMPSHAPTETTPAQPLGLPAES
jgi:membrane protease YdiL (CAAX protease family)